VHSRAWDLTPENDDFTVRDIGNQVQNVEGSVEYGIEHLLTPLLLIIGQRLWGGQSGDGRRARRQRSQGRQALNESKDRAGKVEPAVVAKDIAGELSKIRGISAQASEAEPLAAAHASAAHEH